jgi:hypothetical protein
MKAKDANIRQALIDRYGGIACTKKGGALHGIKSHSMGRTCGGGDLPRSTGVSLGRSPDTATERFYARGRTRGTRTIRYRRAEREISQRWRRKTVSAIG